MLHVNLTTLQKTLGIESIALYIDATEAITSFFYILRFLGYLVQQKVGRYFLQESAALQVCSLGIDIAQMLTLPEKPSSEGRCTPGVCVNQMAGFGGCSIRRRKLRMVSVIGRPATGDTSYVIVSEKACRRTITTIVGTFAEGVLRVSK